MLHAEPRPGRGRRHCHVYKSVGSRAMEKEPSSRVREDIVDDMCLDMLELTPTGTYCRWLMKIVRLKTMLLFLTTSYDTRMNSNLFLCILDIEILSSPV